MKKLKIVGFILLITIVILNICSVLSFAASPIDNPNFWKPDASTDTSLNDKIGGILGVIQVIGVLASVIVLMVLGIKYMLGSAEEKAINKKAMIPYLVGAVMVFSVTTIPNFIFQMSEGLFKEKTPGEIAQENWWNYDCSRDGHKFSTFTGKCDYYQKCGYICPHNTDKGWQDEYNGTRTCLTCYYTCKHTEGYSWISNTQHSCILCNKNESHIFQDDMLLSWNNYCPGCDSTCKHEGFWNSLTGKCSLCYEQCMHIEGFENFKCKTCGYKCRHEGATFTINGDLYICNKCGAACDHNFKPNSTVTACGTCGKSFGEQYEVYIWYDNNTLYWETPETNVAQCVPYIAQQETDTYDYIRDYPLFANWQKTGSFSFEELGLKSGDRRYIKLHVSKWIDEQHGYAYKTEPFEIVVP